MHHIFMIVLLLAALTGCATKMRQPEPDFASFTYVTLVSGPSSGSGTKEARQAMFQGHMANINRLAETGDLLVAGPFANPNDASWRGLFILDVAETAAARAMVASDPGISAGEFAAVIRPLRASTTLRQSLPLYRALEAEQRINAGTTPTNSAAPPALMRAYVIVTAADADRAARAIGDSTFPIVFRGRFTDQDGKGGLFVLDATDPAAVRSALVPASTGPASVDGWFSTSSHVRLPIAARQ